MTKKIIFIFLVSAIIFSACTLQKRSYRPGYYFAWNKKAAALSGPGNTKNNNEIFFKKESAAKNNAVYKNEAEETAEASLNKKILPRKKSRNSKLIFNDECGDLITFKNGDEVNCKVIEIGDYEIKYKRCDNLEGPLITVKKSDVFMVKYANGTKELFNNVKEVKREEKKEITDNTELKAHPLASKSFICAMLSILCIVLTIVGFVLLAAALINGSSFGAGVLLAPSAFCSVTHHHIASQKMVAMLEAPRGVVR